MRACPECGCEEQRTVKDGRELVNLDPVTGKCIACLVASAGPKPMPAPVFDVRKARAGDREDG